LNSVLDDSDAATTWGGATTQGGEAWRGEGVGVVMLAWTAGPSGTAARRCVTPYFFGKNKNLKNYLFSLIIMFIAFMLLHIFILMDV
jgi:hypothetical protein